jgi:hypothetical protein
LPGVDLHVHLEQARVRLDTGDALTGRIAGQLDEFGDDTGTGDVHGGVDAGRRELADPVGEAGSVGRGDGAQPAEIVPVRRTGGADGDGASIDGELDRGRRSGRTSCNRPWRILHSSRFTPAARTTMRIWPAWACGASASTYSRTSGPP